MMEQVRRNPYPPCALVRMSGPSLSANLGMAMPSPLAAAVDLYWIPLGAGGHSVRFNGRVFEAIEALAVAARAT
jgi:hypothetical protein